MPSGEEISAAVYVGTYSNQMIVGHYDPERDILSVRNEYTSYTKALASGRILGPDALERVCHALHEMHEIAQQDGVNEFRIAAASGLRNIENRTQLLISCQKEFGIYPQIFSGRDETRLNFIGAISGILSELPVAMLFLGYRKLLFACGTGKKISNLFELDFGVGDINEKFSLDRHALGSFLMPYFRHFLRKRLGRLPELCNFWRSGLDLTPQFVCVGPLAQSIYTLIERAHTFSRSMIDCPIPLEVLQHMRHKVLYSDRADRLELPGMDPSAVESIAGGISILESFMRACAIEDFRVSAYGLCAGLLKTPPGLLATIRPPSQSGTFLPSRI